MNNILIVSLLALLGLGLGSKQWATASEIYRHVCHPFGDMTHLVWDFITDGHLYLFKSLTNSMHYGKPFILLSVVM